MATLLCVSLFSVDVPDDIPPWLEALATVSDVSVADIVMDGLRHVRMKDHERERIVGAGGGHRPFWDATKRLRLDFDRSLHGRLSKVIPDDPHRPLR